MRFSLANMFASSSRLVGSLVKSLVQQPQTQCKAFNECVGAVAFFHTDITKYGKRHGGFYKKDFNVLRERPVGPHKLLPPGVKHDGRSGPHANYRHKIVYPADGKYTIKKLDVIKLGGRDPVTGRKVIQQVGGGSKQKHRWIDWMRLPNDWPRDGPDLVEKVISINYDPMRKPYIALTGYGDRLRWQIATSDMKEGDLLTTTWKIPKIPVKPIAGNSYPLGECLRRFDLLLAFQMAYFSIFIPGALPTSTKVCLVQKYPFGQDVMFYNERSFGTIVKKVLHTSKF